jgi:hypothetical protein
MDPEDVELTNPPNPADGDAGDTAKGYGIWAAIIFAAVFVGSIAVAGGMAARDRFAAALSSASGGDGQLTINPETGIPVEA